VSVTQHQMLLIEHAIHALKAQSDNRIAFLVRAPIIALHSFHLVPSFFVSHVLN